MNRSVAILAVNEDQEEYERIVFHFLKKTLQEHDICTVNDFEENNIGREIENAAGKTEIFIIISDAVRGKNPFFSFAARELYRRNIRPIVLVSNIDDPEADPLMAAGALEEVWLLEDPQLESWNLNFDTVYLSLERKITYISPENEQEGISALLELIESKALL